MKTKNNNSIYIFFLLLALLFWNPLTFKWIYGDTAAYQQTFAKALFWGIPIIGGLAMFLISKDKLSPRLKNLSSSLAFAGILFGVLVGIDGLIGKMGSSKTSRDMKSNGLIFEPNTKAHYQTLEFDFTSNINSLGLREREFDTDKKGKFRILCLGDSWTFGWGVAAENSWTRQLEDYLKAKGYPSVEVINGGQGGQYTTFYKKYAEKAVPFLKPNLVIVGVLQGDDLAQLAEKNNPSPKILASETLNKDGTLASVGYSAMLFLKTSFANILSIVKKQNSKMLEIRDNWQSSVATAVKDLPPPQYETYNLLTDSAKNLFQSGNLNPGLLANFLANPKRLLEANDPQNGITQSAIAAMKADFKDIKKVCETNRAQLIFANMPDPMFTAHNVAPLTPTEPQEQMQLSSSNQIDAIYQSVAAENGLPYVGMTDYFKQLTDKSAYFFRYDRHPTPKGYTEIAHQIGDYLIKNQYFSHITSK